MSLTTEVSLTLASSRNALKPLGVAGDLAHELFAGAGEIAQLLDGSRWNEATADQTVREQVGYPRRVVHVALATRDVADVWRWQVRG